MNLKKHFGTFSWAVASRFLQLFYGLSFLVVVIPALPVEEHGRYALIFTIFLQLSLLNKYLILNPMIRFGAEAGQFDRMLRTGMYLNGMLYLIFASAIFIASPLIASMLRISVTEVNLVIVLLTVFWIRDFMYCLNQILYRTGRIFFIEAIYWLGSSVGFIYFASLNRLVESTTVLEINIIAALASTIISLMLGLGGLKLFGKIKLEDTKKILAYGFDTLGIGLSNSFIYGIDIWIIGVIYTPKEVGIYNGAKAVWRVLSSINQAVGMLVLPYAARLKSENNSLKLRELFEKVTAYSWVGLTAAACIGILFCDSFYHFFLGGRYMGSILILQIMLIGAPFEGIFNVSGNILYGLGEARTVAKISLKGAMILLVLLFPAIYFFQGIGAAVILSFTLLYLGMSMFTTASLHLNTNLRNVTDRFLRNMSNLLTGGTK